jgi:hypothetical protein
VCVFGSTSKQTDNSLFTSFFSSTIAEVVSAVKSHNLSICSVCGFVFCSAGVGISSEHFTVQPTKVAAVAEARRKCLIAMFMKYENKNFII